MSAAAAKRTVLATASILAIVALAILVPTGGASSARRDSEPPTTPRSLRVAGVTQSLVRIAWDPSTDNVGVEGYYVFGDKGKATVDVLDDEGKPILDDDGRPVGDAPGFTVKWLGCGESSEISVIAFDASQNRSGKAIVTVSTAACGDLQPPTAPSAFTQVATSTDSVVLAWAASSDNVGVVEYGVNRNLQRVATPTQPSVTLTGLSCGSTYEYAVDAADAAGNRSPLSTAYVQTASCPSPSDTISPSTPTGLAASNITQTGLALNWNASSDNVGVTGYDVYRNGTKVASVTSTSATQSGLSCGTSYPFGVRARDAAGRTSAAAQLTVSTAACSTAPPPSTDTISPSTPTGLAASNITQTGLALNWNPSTDNVGVTGYDVYRNGARVASVTSTSANQSGVSCGTSYPFAVRALDAAGRTSAAAQLTVSTADCSTTPPPSDTTPPSTPTGLGISSATRTSVSLTWNPSTDNVGVAGYRLYVNGSFNLTTTQPGTTVSNVSCGTSYTFAVDALDAEGNNSPQASVTGSTAACADTQAPTTPTNVVASSRTATSIALSWSASSDSVGVAGYGLYRGGVEVGSTSTTTGIFAGLTCNTNYTLAVDAYDAAGNRSTKTTVMVSTTACPDTTPPSTPTGLAVSSVTQTGLALGWSASSDNVGVTGYDVYRNGTKVSTVASTSSSQTGLTCGMAYTFGVVARDAAGNASQQVQLGASTSACSPPPTACSTGQFQALYFSNTALSGSPALTNCEASVDHTWGAGGPGSPVPTDRFSARWTGRFDFAAGDTTFSATADDGVRVWVDGTIAIDSWQDQEATTYTATRTLTLGQHDVKVEYYENGLEAVAKVNWSTNQAPPPSSGVPQWYSQTSPWNTPLPANPQVLPQSGQYVSALHSSTQAINANIYGWTPPVYYADASTPRVNVSVVDDYYEYRIENVPMPTDARPSPDNSGGGQPGNGDDNYLMVVDRSTGCEYDYWRAWKDSSGSWRAKNQASFRMSGSGVHEPWAVRASSIALGAGIFRPEEFSAGEINHALGWAIPTTVSGSTYVSPAQRSDGPTSGGIPMGTLFQLDPSIDLNSFQPALAPWQKILARAMQRYGVYVTDTSIGVVALQGQSEVSLRSNQSYPFPRYSTLPRELLSRMRALASPVSPSPLDTWNTAGCAQRYLVG